MEAWVVGEWGGREVEDSKGAGYGDDGGRKRERV
jgi:hypothetical protein